MVNKECEKESPDPKVEKRNYPKGGAKKLWKFVKKKVSKPWKPKGN